MKVPAYTMLLIFIVVAIFTTLQIVNPPENDELEEKATAVTVRDGVVKTNDKYGNLHTAITYDQGVKHGPSYLYYRTGGVMLEMPYVQGKREGKAVKYYEDGEVYAITPYADDEIFGVRKTYFRNGALKAEVPYHNSAPGLGLKEYYQDGTPKPLPEITIRKVETPEPITWFFTVPGCTKPRFYTGSLFNNSFLVTDPRFVDPLPMQSEEAYLKQEDAEHHPDNLICECTTRAGHPYITRVVI